MVDLLNLQLRDSPGNLYMYTQDKLQKFQNIIFGDPYTSQINMLKIGIKIFSGTPSFTLKCDTGDICPIKSKFSAYSKIHIVNMFLVRGIRF